MLTNLPENFGLAQSNSALGALNSLQFAYQQQARQAYRSLLPAPIDSQPSKLLLLEEI